MSSAVYREQEGGGGGRYIKVVRKTGIMQTITNGSSILISKAAIAYPTIFFNKLDNCG
jgi:hypothetical protein